MKPPRITPLASKTTSVEPGFRMLWRISPVSSGVSLLLGLLTTVCQVGCGQANSDGYVTIDESHSAFFQKGSPESVSTEAQAGQAGLKGPTPEPVGTEEISAFTDTANAETTKPAEGETTVAEASTGNPDTPPGRPAHSAVPCCASHAAASMPRRAIRDWRRA